MLQFSNSFSFISQKLFVKKFITLIYSLSLKIGKNLVSNQQKNKTNNNN